MAAAAFQFTGYVTTGYPDYRDVVTGRMLVADPGSAYVIAAIDGKAAVPPGDGRWAAATTSAGVPPAPPPVPPVPSPEPVPADESGAA